MLKQWELVVDGRHENLATIAEFVLKAAQAAGIIILKVSYCLKTVASNYQNRPGPYIALREVQLYQR